MTARADEPQAATRQQILAVWKQYKDAWNARDAASVAAVFGADGSFRSATMAAPVLGADAVAKTVTVTFTAFPDFQVHAVSAEFLDDRRLVERWTIAGELRIRELEHRLLAFEMMGESRRDAFEPNDEYRALFSRIVRLVPAPVGLGPARAEGRA